MTLALLRANRHVRFVHVVLCARPFHFHLTSEIRPQHAQHTTCDYFSDIKSIFDGQEDMSSQRLAATGLPAIVCRNKMYCRGEVILFIKYTPGVLFFISLHSHSVIILGELMFLHIVSTANL